jgi:hypothetical protein
MWRTRLEVEALLEKSERTRNKAAEIQRQLQTLILYWERLLQRQRHNGRRSRRDFLQRGITGSSRTASDRPVLCMATVMVSVEDRRFLLNSL